MRGRILIVDDSVTVRADLGGVLSAAGFNVTLCETLAAARQALDKEAFSLAILDVVLPDGDGVELLTELRASPRSAQLPVLMLSSEAAVAHRLKGLSHGASDYVGKPYDAAYVVRRTCELVQVSEVDGTPRLVAAGRRRRLLLVDDNGSFRMVAAEELRKDGHDIILAASGEEALQLLQAQPVDCVLVDLFMPGMDGIQVTQALRSLPGLARVPVLMLTARFEARLMEQALAAGVDTFCTKSADFEMLRAQVRNELRRRLVDGGSPAPAPAAPPPAPPAQVSAEKGPSLFDEVVARSGLSPVIAASTVARACRRAEVEVQALDATSLRKVLPGLRETLRVFLSEQETDRRMQTIEALTRPPSGGSLQQAG